MLQEVDAAALQDVAATGSPDARIGTQRIDPARQQNFYRVRAGA
jgi:hypothetical protein